MRLIGVLTNEAGAQYDFYISEVQGKPFYNLVPHGQIVDEGGYFDPAYLFKMKGFK